MGYAPAVQTDEIQAYALTGWPSEYGRPTKEDLALQSVLKEVEKEYLE